MNDATRELGAALGVAVLGTIAASHYASAMNHLTRHLPAATQEAARTLAVRRAGGGGEAARRRRQGVGHGRRSTRSSTASTWP